MDILIDKFGNRKRLFLIILEMDKQILIFGPVSYTHLDVYKRQANMTKKTAKNVVKTIFQSPSPFIKIEFQGGDPSTDFEMVKYIIEEAEWQNLFKKRVLEFVICTNLTLLNEDMVKYLKKHKCMISTSLDGPKDLHDTNRPLQNKDLSLIHILLRRGSF